MKSPFAALLLAGGKSRRMGSDKALLNWNGEALWLVQLSKLNELKPERLIVASREEQNLRLNADPAGVDWLYDLPDEDRGPLAVIQRVLDLCQMPLLVIAVDMPWMTADFLKSEIIAKTGRGRCIESDQGLEPLAALYVPAMLPLLNEALAAGQRSLQVFLKCCAERHLLDVRQATEAERILFSNVNTVAEWINEKGRSGEPA